MKKTAFIFGALFASLVVTGALFKIMHWPGASILLVVGVACSLIFIFSAVKYLYEKSNK